MILNILPCIPILTTLYMLVSKSSVTTVLHLIYFVVFLLLLIPSVLLLLLFLGCFGISLFVVGAVSQNFIMIKMRENDKDKTFKFIFNVKAFGF